jgi:hypothetical protein
MGKKRKRGGSKSAPASAPVQPHGESQRLRCAVGGPSSSSAAVTFSAKELSFESSFYDHFETPLQAYRDVEQLLDSLGKDRKDLILYDPFYCRGSCVSHLHSLGFNSVINENVDFWKTLASGEVPPFDVLITNPPYSEESKAKCIQFALDTQKPALVLLPTYCANKHWWNKLMDSQTDAFFVCPSSVYNYEHALGKGKDSSPFHSSWFCMGFPSRPSFGRKSDGCVVCAKDELEKLGVVSFQKRLNPRQRAKLRKKGLIGGGGSQIRGASSAPIPLSVGAASSTIATSTSATTTMSCSVRRKKKNKE